MGNPNSPNSGDEKLDNTWILEAELIKKWTKFTILEKWDRKRIALVSGVVELYPWSTIEVINVEEEEVLTKIWKDNKKNENQEKDDEKWIIKFVKKYFSYILSLWKSWDVPEIDIKTIKEENLETQQNEPSERKKRLVITLKIISPSWRDKQEKDFSLNVLTSYLTPLQNKIKKIN